MYILLCFHSLRHDDNLLPLPPPLSLSLPPSFSAELEALGDEYLGELDEDAGFLDAAVAAPDPPSGVPGGKAKVQVHLKCFQNACFHWPYCSV